MSVLEEVSQMKTQGFPEGEIIKKLQDQGVSPKSINDALNHSEIKNAVSNEEEHAEYEMSPKLTTPSPQGSMKSQEIQDEEMYSPQPQQEEYPPQPPPQEEYYPQEYSQVQQQAPAYTPGFDTNTIIEISEQVFSEKIEKIQKQVDEFSEFKSLAKSRIENVSERVKRIELTIDKLQSAILEKIGSYGSNLESVKKEMSMMQDSFSKMLSPLAERAEAKHHPHKRKALAKGRTRKR